MNAAGLLVALLLAGQVGPAGPPNRPGPTGAPPRAGEKPAAEQPEQTPLPLTLDEIAAGAKNDAFVDEYLKDKQLTLFGQVQSIERVTEEGKSGNRYRLVMNRTGHEDRAVDVEVFFYFDARARKDLAALTPETSKITVQGKCASAHLQSLTRGLGFMLVLEDCQIVATPSALQAALRTPGPAVIPNVTDPEIAPPPAGVPGPALPRLPMQP